MTWNSKSLIRTGVVLCLCVVGAAWVSPTQAQTTNAPLTTAARNVALDREQEVTLLTFGLDRIQALQYELPDGIPLWQYPATLIYILLSLLAAKAIDLFTRVYLKRWAEKTSTKFDDVMVGLINGPIRIIVLVILLHIGLRVFRWPNWIEDYLSKGLQVVVAVSITYVAIRFIDMLMAFWAQRHGPEVERTFNDQLFPIIRKTSKVFVIIIAILVTSQNLGLNITGLIASLG